MAISTLSKFTVPLANDQSSASQGLLMPKLQYRFRAILENFGVSTPRSELTKQVVDITRPNLTFDNVTLDVYNSKVYVAGKHTWDAITITLRDDVNNSVTKLVGEQIQKQLTDKNGKPAFDKNGEPKMSLPYVGYKIEASGEVFPVADIKVREDGRGYGGQFKFEMILNQKSFAKRLEKAQSDVYGDE